MSTPDYIVDPIQTDYDSLEQEAFDVITARWPDWQPADGGLTAWMVSACVAIIAEARTLANDVPPAIFRYFGTTVLGLAPIDATPSVVSATVAVTDNPAGRTIEAGWVVGIPSGEDILGFEVVEDVLLSAGALSTAPGQVVLRSLDDGEVVSGLGSQGDVVELVDPPTSWVDSITLAGSTSGGVDAEDDETYRARLSARLTLLSPRPILARDFALLARDIAAQNGVSALAVALDLYDPVSNTYGNERYVTVVMKDEFTGANIEPAIKTIVDNELQALREINFKVSIINPTETTIDVTYSVTTVVGANVAATLVAADAAVIGYLSRANWGAPEDGSRGWVNADEVRRMEIGTVINNTPGVKSVITLTVGKNGGAQTSNEVTTLTGPAPITKPGAIVSSLAV